MKENKNVLSSLGITLAIAGISCMAMIKGLIGKNLQILSVIVVILSVILLAKGQQFRYYTKPTKEMGLIFLYTFVTLMMCLFSDISVTQNGYGFIYQAAYFLQIYLLWNTTRDNNRDFYVEIGFWLCGIFSITALILLIRNSTGSLFINSLTSVNGEYLFNRSTIGTLSFITLSMTLAYKTKSKWEKIFKSVFIVVAVIVLIASSRRSVYLATIISLLLHFRNTGGTAPRINKNSFTKWFLIIISIVFIISMIYNNSSDVRESLEHAWTMLTNGVLTFLGKNSSDMSAAMRVSSAETVMNEYLHNSTVFQQFFGRGYMTKWVDIPFIQAFWDLGLVGGILFCIIQFIVPIRHLIRKADSPGVMAAQYLATLSVFEGLANSFPYGHFFTIVLLLMMDDSRNIMGE